MHPLTRVAAGFTAAWAIHDLEELLTMARSSRTALAKMPERIPLPEGMRERGVSQAHVNLSIGIMAANVALASWEGVRTQGRSALFRGALLVFGAHGVTHLLSSAVLRGYSTGVVTSPLVVLPFWWWARREYRRVGVRDLDAKAVGVAVAAVPVLVAVHVATWLALGKRSIGR